MELFPLSDGLQLLLAPSIDYSTITVVKINTAVGSVLCLRQKTSIFIHKAIARRTGHDRGAAFNDPVALMGCRRPIIRRSPSDSGLSQSGHSCTVAFYIGSFDWAFPVKKCVALKMKVSRNAENI
jgi:hypothetical protein